MDTALKSINLSFQEKRMKVSLFLLSAIFVLSAAATIKGSANVDVIDILAKIGLHIPNWLAVSIALVGDVAAIIAVLATAGYAAIPIAIVDQLVGASTAAA